MSQTETLQKTNAKADTLARKNTQLMENYSTADSHQQPFTCIPAPTPATQRDSALSEGDRIDAVLAAIVVGLELGVNSLEPGPQRDRLEELVSDVRRQGVSLFRSREPRPFRFSRTGEGGRAPSMTELAGIRGIDTSTQGEEIRP